MIDPPVNSTEWLLAVERQSRSSSTASSSPIAMPIMTLEAFQKILEEGRIDDLYDQDRDGKLSCSKYSAFSGESPDYLRQPLFSFQPVYIGRPVTIHGGEFDIFYALHSIPTMGFRLSFQGKSFVYSSDHQGDLEVQKNHARRRGTWAAARFEQLHNVSVGERRDLPRIRHRTAAHAAEIPRLAARGRAVEDRRLPHRPEGLRQD